MISGLFRRTPKQDNIDALYGAIVAQGRAQAFYRDFGVPDTVTGRLEMILIHTFLLFRRARGGDGVLRGIGQGVFDRFCDDMDANLREMGVGDLAVPKHMQRIGEAFYGRAAVYDAALDANDQEALMRGVMRNVFPEGPGQTERADGLAAYIQAADVELSRADDTHLAGGQISFPVPERYLTRQQ